SANELIDIVELNKNKSKEYDRHCNQNSVNIITDKRSGWNLLHLTTVVATIAIVYIAIITLLSCVYCSITTRIRDFYLAGATATVTIRIIVIITLLTWINCTVTTGNQSTLIITTRTRC